MMRWALESATRVIAVSRPLATLAQRLGVPAERIDVIENGVDTDRFKPMNVAEARRLVGFDAGTPLLIGVGHLVPLKGFHRIIGALPELEKQFPGLSLVIVGGSADGGYVQQLQQLVSDLRLASRVIFAGSLPTEKVAHWLNASDLFVLCSDREGCPNVVWEAMACGRPVVSPKVGAVEQMVPPEAGILFETPSDGPALVRSISLALNTQWDVERIRTHAEAHTWASVAQRVIRQWQLALGRPVAAGEAAPSARHG